MLLYLQRADRGVIKLCEMNDGFATCARRLDHGVRGWMPLGEHMRGLISDGSFLLFGLLAGAPHYLHPVLYLASKCARVLRFFSSGLGHDASSANIITVGTTKQPTFPFQQIFE